MISKNQPSIGCFYSNTCPVSVCGTGLGVLSGVVKKTRLRFEARERARAGAGVKIQATTKYKRQRPRSYQM